MSAEEKILIERCRRGDQAAFGELVQRYQRRIYGVAFAMLHHRENARDITQETFIRVYQNLASFQGVSSFYTWLYRITINLCLDHLRKKSRQHEKSFEEEGHSAGSEEAMAAGILPQPLGLNPRDELLRKELRQQIEKAMARLSPNHRAVLLLREVEGLSYEEMAEIMQCSTGTIMSRLFNARRQMQRLLLKNGAQIDEAKD